MLGLWRHRVRTAVGTAGIAFGVAAMLCVLSIVLGAISMFEKILSSDSQYLVFERNVSDLFFSSVPDDSVGVIRDFEMVDSANPILFGIVSTEGHPVITCFGIESTDPRLEKAQWIDGSREDFTADSTRVFLGSRCAEFMEAGQGDEVEIGKDRFTVGGVFKTDNGFEDGGVFMPLHLAQDFFHREGLSSIVAVKLHDKEQGDAFKETVHERYPDLMAMENEEFSNSYSQFKILTATSWAVGICAFLLGGMGVANTMLMSVFSRVREIAILRVCGFSKWQVAVLILGEAMLLSAVGVLVGFSGGYLLLNLLGHVPQLQGYVKAVTELWMILGIIGVAALTSVLGAFYPAWFASKIQPAEALRYE